MQNVIFGSGIVGLMAKCLLPTWTLIPFARSRFFVFNPALDDNFIIRDTAIDEAMRDLCQVPQLSTFLYRRAWDVQGQLYNKYDRNLCSDWLLKLFGSQVPPQSEPYLQNRMDLTIYEVRVNQLYAQLMAQMLPEIKTEATKGKITEIGDHYYVRNGQREEFDHAINTIPLPALAKLVRQPLVLPAKPLHYLHVRTERLNFEGYNQILVVTPALSFFRVTNIAPQRYLFYCHEEIAQPGPYLMALLPDFEILDGTSIQEALPLGPIPQLAWMEAKGIYSIGSYAQWDWCMDVGSCLLRLLRYTQRSFQPFKRRLDQ